MPHITLPVYKTQLSEALCGWPYLMLHMYELGVLESEHEELVSSKETTVQIISSEHRMILAPKLHYCKLFLDRVLQLVV